MSLLFNRKTQNESLGYTGSKNLHSREAECEVTCAGVVLQFVSCPAHTPEAAECVLTAPISAGVRDQTTLINICNILIKVIDYRSLA